MQAALRSKALLKELYEILVEDKSDKLTPSILVLADLRKFLVDLPSKRLLDKDIKPCIEASNPAGTIESLDQFQAIMNNIVKANTEITSTDEIVFSFLVAPCRRYSLKSQHLEKTNIQPLFESLTKQKKDLEGIWRAWVGKPEQLHPTCVAVLRAGGSVKALHAILTGKTYAAQAPPPPPPASPRAVQTSALGQGSPAECATVSPTHINYKKAPEKEEKKMKRRTR